MNDEFELPPATFTNIINELRYQNRLTEDFDYRRWRQSAEWKIYVTGYNACVEQTTAKIQLEKNLGEPDWKIFGRDEE